MMMPRTLCRHLASYGLLLLLALGLFACQTTTVVKPQDTNRFTAEDVQIATHLLDHQDWEAAHQMYRYLAALSIQPERSGFQQKAALMLYRAGRLDEIEPFYQTLPEEDLLPDDQLHRNVLLSAAYLQSGKVYQSLGNLPDLELINAQEYRAIALHVRAQGVLAIGKPLESAELRIQAGTQLEDGQLRIENQQLIWDALNRISEPVVLRALAEPQTQGLRGWLELNLIARRSNMLPDKIGPWLEKWYQLYPEHEAVAEFAPGLLEESRLIYIQPTRIALLLPLADKLKNVAEAIQNGFLQAYYSDPARPLLEIINVSDNPSDFYLQYNQAIQNGADFIVGPLDKKLVNELSLKESLKIPTLTLNYSDGVRTGINNLYQFGLKPEDEAEQIADYALQHGLYHAVTLTPNNNLGSRLHKAFSERFETLGGQVVDQAQYPPDKHDYSTAIKQLLNLNDSERRHAILDRVNGQKSEFIPRRRQDVDMVFIAGNPRQARLIKPQLKFHHAKDLPVYATSSISSSISDPDADRDLDEILFVDTPWALEHDSNVDYRQIRSFWPKQSERYARFFALGLDAYRLIPSLRRLLLNPEERVQLNTGAISVDADGRIHRHLLLATYQNGRAQVLQKDSEQTALKAE